MSAVVQWDGGWEEVTHQAGVLIRLVCFFFVSFVLFAT
jgi:hypothetical protein